MNRETGRPGIVFAGIYAALFLLSGLYAIYRLVYHTANSELCGVPALLITLPWSIPFAKLQNANQPKAIQGRARCPHRAASVHRTSKNPRPVERTFRVGKKSSPK